MEKLKWLYSFAVLIVTVGWAMFTLIFVANAIDKQSAASIMAASGASLLLGAMISWNGLIVQHWFRKSKPE